MSSGVMARGMSVADNTIMVKQLEAQIESMLEEKIHN